MSLLKIAVAKLPPHQLTLIQSLWSLFFLVWLPLFQNDVLYCLQGVRVERSGQFAVTRVDSVDTKKRVIR